MSAAKKILIVDDDKTLSDGLAKALTKNGFEAFICARAQEALEKLKLNEFKAIFVDCMLPQMGGVDLATKISEGNLSEAPIFLMSGVYKDKRYIREAMSRSHAAEFLTKPFNLDDVIKLAEKSTQTTNEISRPPLFRIFSDPTAHGENILRAIDNTESIPGLDLPIVYSFLLNAGVSGHLQVMEAGGDKYDISFLPHKIVNVETNHRNSYLGVLLVEKGFCTIEQVDKIMSAPGQKKLGQRLMEANFISPHSILEVMADQLVIRLSKTIYDTAVSINFSASTDIDDGPGVEKETFTLLLHDWIMSKISFAWLKAFYVSWMDQEILRGSRFERLEEAMLASVFKRLPNLGKMLISGKTIDRLLTDGGFNEHDFFVALHFLSTLQVIAFGSREQFMNFDNARTRLKRIKDEMKSKTYFEILNVSKNAREADIKQAYHELAKTFHPDKIPREAPQDIKDLNQEIFSVTATAFNTIKDNASRMNYLRELEQGRAENLLRAEAIFEHGKQLLKTGNAAPALESFELALKSKLNRSDLLLYRIWTKLRLIQVKNSKVKIRDVEMELEQIPPEDRHDALFFFVKGLFMKTVGSNDQARNYFEKSYAVDPNFIEARRELNVLKLKSEGTKTDILRGDIKDVAKLLFKKRK